jgi:hypothetical protein
MENKFSSLVNKFMSWFQFRIDTTKYFLDRPQLDYQPLPWAGIPHASIRGEATEARWKDMQKHIGANCVSLKDIGSCFGYFCIAASVERKMYSFGIDFQDRFLRIANYGIPQESKDHCNFIKLYITAETAPLLPYTDITLCLSIWHHWVSTYGLDKATSILQSLWKSTNHVLFFESGEEEIKDEFKMPFPDDQPAKLWLGKYLKETLPSSIVEEVGRYEVGKYSHYQLKDFKRTLFKVSKMTV